MINDNLWLNLFIVNRSTSVILECCVLFHWIMVFIYVLKMKASFLKLINLVPVETF